MTLRLKFTYYLMNNMILRNNVFSDIVTRNYTRREWYFLITHLNFPIWMNIERINIHKHK